jgi:hypothetical protein
MKADNPKLEDPLFVHRLLILYRYFSWADAMRENYEVAKVRDLPQIEKAKAEGKSYPYHLAMAAEMYMCYWFSSLQIVVEGWNQLCFSNPRITQLLRSPHRKLLRDFRNATFHPSDWTDERIEVLVQKGQESYDWVVSVTDAFREFLQLYVKLTKDWAMEPN